MVPNQSSPNTITSSWPYEVKVEKKQNLEEKVSPSLKQDFQSTVICQKSPILN